MIEYKTGNLLNEESEAIVNTVNCVGVMGKGIALQFKKKWPENFNNYLKACNHNLVQPGKMHIFETKSFINPKYIINFPTKRHWKGKSKIEDIKLGLSDLVLTIQKYQIKSIALPPLGCGLGGLEWSEVKPLIEKSLIELKDVQVKIYEPNEMTSSELNYKKASPVKMSAGRAALIKLVDHYLNSFLDPMISLLEIHKLMYFLQESGIDLKLKYSKAHYGPYNENLRHVLNEIEGHYISGYRGDDKPEHIIKLVPGATAEADQFLQEEKRTLEHIEKVIQLVEGYESSFGLELLASVHWIIKQENTTNLDEVIFKVANWNKRKKDIFSSVQIAKAYQILLDKKWI